MSYIMIIILLASLAGGFYGGCEVQKGKVERLKADVAQLEGNLKECQQVNVTNIEATTALKEDVKKANRSCASRVAAKDALIKKLQEIDNLKPTGGTTSEKDSSVTNPDPILDRLNKLFVPSG